MQWFRGGLEFKARIILNHATLGVRAINKKKDGTVAEGEDGAGNGVVTPLHGGLRVS